MESVCFKPHVRLTSRSIIWELFKNVSVSDFYCIKLNVGVCCGCSVACPVYRDQSILWLDRQRVAAEVPFITISADLDRNMINVLRSSSFVVVAECRLRHSVDYIAVLRIRLLIDLVVPLIFYVRLASSNNVPELLVSNIKFNSLLSSVSIEQCA